jgi:hypothetical protein
MPRAAVQSDTSNGAVRRWWPFAAQWIVKPLAFGVVLTVAVSWAFAAWLPQKVWNRYIWVPPFPNYPDRIVCEYRHTGAIRRAWWTQPRAAAAPTLHPFWLPIEGALDRAIWTNPFPAWGRHTSVDQPPAGIPDFGCEHATGWPFVALWYQIEVSNQTYEVSAPGGIRLFEQGRFLAIPTIRALPYRPIWPGIVLNTLCYAALWVAVNIAGIAAMRWIRRRRGRCGSCGYDTRGLPAGACPECGHLHAGGNTGSRPTSPMLMANGADPINATTPPVEIRP